MSLCFKFFLYDLSFRIRLKSTDCSRVSNLHMHCSEKTVVWELQIMGTRFVTGIMRCQPTINVKATRVIVKRTFELGRFRFVRWTARGLTPSAFSFHERTTKALPQYGCKWIELCRHGSFVTYTVQHHIFASLHFKLFESFQRKMLYELVVRKGLKDGPKLNYSRRRLLLIHLVMLSAQGVFVLRDTVLVWEAIYIQNYKLTHLNLIPEQRGFILIIFNNSV